MDFIELILNDPMFSSREEAILSWILIIAGIIALMVYVIYHSEWWQNRKNKKETGELD
jgi:hypothetical protein